MSRGSRKQQSRVVQGVALFLCLTIGMTIKATESDSTALTSQTRPDTTTPKTFKKLKSHSTWETLVSLPTWIVHFPIDLTLEGMEYTVGLVLGTHLPQRIADLLISDDGLRKIRPIFSSRSGLGLRYSHLSLLSPESRLQVGVSAGVRRRQHYFIRLDRVPFYRTGFRGELLLEYRNLSDEAFFGLGHQSVHENRSSYAHELLRAEFALYRKVPLRGLYLRAATGYQVNNILPGRSPRYPSIEQRFGQVALPGKETGLRFWYVEGAMILDNRDAPGNPRQGGEVRLFAGLYRQATGDPHRYAFTKVGITVSRCLHLFYGRTLVLRGSAELTRTMPGRQVPFYYLAELGSQETIRGYTRGRFRDYDRLSGSLEYRYPIWNRRVRGIDAALFWDFGQVAPNLEKVALPNLRLAYGAGLRFWSHGDLVAKLEVGFTGEGHRVIFNLY